MRGLPRGLPFGLGVPSSSGRRASNRVSIEFFSQRVSAIKRAFLPISARQDIRGTMPVQDQTYIGVVQARSESSGAVQANSGDAGGQIFMFTMNPTD